MLKKEYLIYKLSEAAREACKIDNELFPMYNVKRGLRNEDGSGVLVGLTQVGNVVGYERLPEGGLKAIPGKLFYRGYDVEDLARDFIKEKRFGFEEVAYLLLSGKLPDKEELSAFKELLNDNMPLEQKTKMNILDLEGQNIMNILARSVLEMYTFDANPDNTSRDNLMRQSIELTTDISLSHSSKVPSSISISIRRYACIRKYPPQRGHTYRLSLTSCTRIGFSHLLHLRHKERRLSGVIAVGRLGIFSGFSCAASAALLSAFALSARLTPAEPWSFVLIEVYDFLNRFLNISYSTSLISQS